MKLTETPDYVTWPEMHYIFAERIGPIPQNAPLTWQEFYRSLPQLRASSPIMGFLSLYNMSTQVYRAGAWVDAKPADTPGNLRYERFPGGKYARFVLTGPYSYLPRATGRVCEIVSEKKIPLRDAYHIEYYANDPQRTPQNELVTEILFPVAWEIVRIMFRLQANRLHSKGLDLQRQF